MSQKTNITPIKFKCPNGKEYTPKQNSETDDFTKRELKPAKKKKVPQIFKKIYKKIAALTHPDRFLYLNPSGDEYKLKNKLYIKATTALEDNDYETLLDVMTELEIELDEVNSDIIEALKLKVNKLSNTISTIHNNPVWIWGHASQEQRFRIFEHIFKQRYKK